MFQEALRWRDRRHLRTRARRTRARARWEFTFRLADLVEPLKSNPDNERLAQHLERHLDDWFTFLEHPDADATNYRAEQAIRPAVVNRKVWGGNRTLPGARAQEILTSVLETCRQQAISALDYVSQVLCGLAPSLLHSATPLAVTTA